MLVLKVVKLLNACCWALWPRVGALACTHGAQLLIDFISDSSSGIVPYKGTRTSLGHVYCAWWSDFSLAVAVAR